MRLFLPSKFITSGYLVLISAFFMGTANADSGKELYELNCSACHGVSGEAVLPGSPSFSKGERLEKSDADLLKSISAGLKAVMPPWQGILTDDEMKSTVAHIRSLAK